MFNYQVAIFCLVLTCTYLNVKAECERASSIEGAEDACWTNKVKFTDRIHYTTHSVLNFAKEKLGIGTEEQFHPQKCDYYQCIFEELKMLNGGGYPDYNKIVSWIDGNIIYNDAKTQYDKLKECNTALSECIESNHYFSGDLPAERADDARELQDKCEVLQEFMKCLVVNGTECSQFVYP